MKAVYNILFTSFAISVALLSCTKNDNTGIDNPYSNVTVKKPDTTANLQVSATSIQGLHRDLFKPTCSNSGCHDGTFEPDFRTVQSTYNTLVHIKPIKNDSAGTFQARVIPGNADASILVYRMTTDLGGNSGIMPIVLDPKSEYPAHKAMHIQNVKTWINNGALDFNGNPPPTIDYPPQILGLTGLIGGSPVARGGKYEPMLVSAGGNVELWFSLTDDKVAQNALTGMKINWSTDPSVYDKANEKSMSQGVTKNMTGLYGSSTAYSWYYSFSTAGLKSNDVIWFQITCNDGVNANYQIPNANSMFFLKKYFAIKIQ